MKKFRQNGAVGALLDEYEKAINELNVLVATISASELVLVVDPKTSDQNCKSIQTILTHVIKAGYCYVIGVRNSLGESLKFPNKILLNNSNDYIIRLNEMFAYNIQLFEDYPNIKLEESDANKKIKFEWGQVYDIEQIFEHAIVHILRHRRQIEKFLTTIRS